MCMLGEKVGWVTLCVQNWNASKKPNWPTLNFNLILWPLFSSNSETIKPRPRLPWKRLTWGLLCLLSGPPFNSSASLISRLTFPAILYCRGGKSYKRLIQELPPPHKQYNPYELLLNWERTRESWKQTGLQNKSVEKIFLTKLEIKH